MYTVTQGVAMLHSNFSLLDVPLPWLSQLIDNHLDHRSQGSLACTCKVFRDLWWEHADQVVCLGTTEAPAAKASSFLQVLAQCRPGANVRVLLKDPKAEPLGTVSPRFSCWLAALCSHASVAPGLPFHHITTVELQGHVLGDIIPVELAMACPNMTRFIRWGRICSWENQDFEPVACPQLQQLTINHLPKCKEENSQAPTPFEQLKQQLQNLPKLEHFECSVEDDGNSATMLHLIDSIKVLSQQSTCLHIQCESNNGLVKLLASSWPQLRTLQLPHYSLDDLAELRLALLQAPQLSELHVAYVRATRDFIQRPSGNLRRLTVKHMYVSNLAYFPLSGLHTLCMEQLVVDDDCQEHITAALEAVASMSAVLRSHDSDTLNIYNNTEDEPPPGLASLFRLIPHKDIMLPSDQQVDEKWLQLLAQVDCSYLTLAPQALKPSCWSTLLQQLPKLHTVYLIVADEGLPDADLLGAQVCILYGSATRPFTLHMEEALRAHLGPVWQEKVDTFMHECCHKHDPTESLGESSK